MTTMEKAFAKAVARYNERIDDPEYHAILCVEGRYIVTATGCLSYSITPYDEPFPF